MRTNQVVIEVSPEWERWVEGFGRDAFGRAMEGNAKKTFQAAAEVLFDRSQTYVHVLSGALKRSGKVSMAPSGPNSPGGPNSVTALVSYGNEYVDYALYEHARGGSHAYLQRAWEATHGVFGSALPDAWEATMQTFSGPRLGI